MKDIAKAVTLMTKNDLRAALNDSRDALNDIQSQYEVLTESHNQTTSELAELNVGLGQLTSMCIQLLQMSKALKLDPATVNETLLQGLVIDKRRLTEIVTSLLN